MNISASTISGHPRRTPYAIGAEDSGADARRWFFFVIAHVPLAYVIQLSMAVSTVHAVGSLVFGLYFLWNDRSPTRVVYTVAYIVGAEVLWRGGSLIFYEFGKYAISLLLILAILKYGVLQRVSKIPVVYFCLLIPSIAMMGVIDRQGISFNISGPFSLAAATLLFSALRIEKLQFRNILMCCLAPIAGTASIGSASSISADVTDFSAGLATRIATQAGGLGTNQFATILGLGILICFLLILVCPEPSWFRWAMLATMIWLTAQCLLSFSRGGFWAAYGAIVAASLCLLGSAKWRGAVLGMAILLFVVFNFLILPVLAIHTGGALQARFQDTDLTTRDQLMLADLDLFWQNPVLGVGPGGSKLARAGMFGVNEHMAVANPHTEFTRVLAEHGIFGLLALLCIFWMSYQRLVGRSLILEKACVISLMVWTFLSLCHSAMRLAAPGFIFGLAFALLVIESRGLAEQRR